ncbi:hypothetical protein P1994_10425 [Xanthomonas perforans]|uniref:hypothetical protein n=1 Tax=Xanthomonas perforans TaxID=442694 RepID=UPI000ADECD17|nr:hypothetical protein [Xanthomonas perforans]
MAFALPDAVACFFAASNSGDAALLLPHLADAVVVYDEGREHRGAGFGRLPAEPAAAGACVPVSGRQDCGAANSLMRSAW